MKIIDIIKGNKPSLSFEVFPPKTFDSLETVRRVTEEIADLRPGYMSVTYGAGGSTDIYTPEIASCIAARGVTPLAHLSCIGATEEKVSSILAELKRRGIDNVLALRGDLPEGVEKHEGVYRFASDLVAKIRDVGGFCIGGACYPEGHPESASLGEDIRNLKIKADAGCEFLTTQMFFDNEIIYGFMDKLAAAGITVPVVPGIMPVTNAKQIIRITSISGNALPKKFMRIIDRYGDNPEAMKQAGIAFAIEQIIDLYAGGFNAVHVYSMNKPDVARSIQSGMAKILGI
ncbi:MAG: methylenetetrahydrofolate reductase [Clostridia bacterium]|nr:methylenetetrahydrofolate reductase [Clostridia bacterium]